MKSLGGVAGAKRAEPAGFARSVAGLESFAVPGVVELAAGEEFPGKEGLRKNENLLPDGDSFLVGENVQREARGEKAGVIADSAPIGNGAAEFGGRRGSGGGPFDVAVNPGALGEIELDVDPVGVEEAAVVFEREPEIHRSVGEDTGWGLKAKFKM